MDSRTSAIDIMSSLHGRERRAERGISKRDLKAAVKYGIKETGYPCPKTGERRWKFTFAGITYVTNESCTVEVTSWPVPLPDLPMMDISHLLRARHKAFKAMLLTNPKLVTSHTVLVVDQSGSMKESDVFGYRNRSKAVYSILANELVKEQLARGVRRESDVVSLIEMRDDADLVIDREPMDMELYNMILARRDDSKPRSHGNYHPALQRALEVLRNIDHESCALSLVFLSDGKPSDRLPSGYSSKDQSSWLAIVAPAVRDISMRFGKKLVFSTVGFAVSTTDFTVLEGMANLAVAYGCHGSFKHCDLMDESLTKTVSTLTDTLTASRTLMSKLYDSGDVSSKMRTVRNLPKEDARSRDAGGWEAYPVAKRHLWSAERGAWTRDVPLVSPEATGIAVRKIPFAEGAERVVFQFQEFNKYISERVGPIMVAKESRFLGDVDSKKNFHEVFCITQYRAEHLAEKFNKAVARLSSAIELLRVPQINFLSCCVYVVPEPRTAEPRGMLVEKMLDNSQYKKWNNNKGFVDRDGEGEDHERHAGEEQYLDLCFAVSKLGIGPKLDAIGESDEDDYSDEDEEEDEVKEVIIPATKSPDVSRFPPGYFPQAFSHFSYIVSRRRHLVCDLQGVFNDKARPPVFEMTDPVIHCRSKGKKAGTFGRTDRGERGVHDFFQTHSCNDLCKLLRLPNNTIKAT